MVAAWPSAAAHINAVCPFQCSCALGSAPASSSSSTASTLPDRAAVINAVSPSMRDVFGLAPASSSAAITGALPSTQASESGRTP